MPKEKLTAHDVSLIRALFAEYCYYAKKYKALSVKEIAKKVGVEEKVVTYVARFISTPRTPQDEEILKLVGERERIKEQRDNITVSKIAEKFEVPRRTIESVVKGSS